MLRSIVLCCVILIAGCAAPQKPTASPSVPVDYGPTLMKKVPGGYELANRKLRLVIDEKTGDVTYFGTPDGTRNLLTPPGITMQLARQPEAKPEGYVEKRDDQTWQYLGDTVTGVRWRKIYCLNYDAVDVTCLVENRTRDAIDTAIAVRASFAGGEMVSTGADAADLTVGQVHISLRAFNEGKPPKPDWAALIGDSKTLQPNERIGITMEWRAEGL